MLGELVFVILGLCFGSFSNALIYRIDKGISIRGRSQCPRCKHQLAAVDLIPVCSYLVLGGKCRFCKKEISIQYPLVEAVSAILFFVAYTIYPFEPLMALIHAAIFWLLLNIAVFDLRTSTIPDLFSVPLILIALGLQLTEGNFPVLAMLTGIGFFGIQWVVSKGAWLGSGDIFLAAGIGAFVGTVFLTGAVIFFAYVIGAVIISFLLLTGKVKRKAHIPFGPFLVLGTFTVLLFQERLEFIASVWF